MKTLTDAVVSKLLSLLKEYIDGKVSSIELCTVVTTLPDTGDADKIYLVASDASETGNLYAEYVYVDGAWEKVGEFKADVDLSDYSTTSEVQTLITNAIAAIAEATTSAAGLMSAADKTKLDGIEDYTEDEITALFNSVFA